LVAGQSGGVSHLYMNNQDGTFVEVAGNAGIGASGDLGKTVGFFDSDNDGDLDILVNNPAKLWRNNLNNTNYLKVMAFGNGTVGGPGSSNGSAITPIGTQIIVRGNDGFYAYREIIPSQNQLAPPHIQHIGGVDPAGSYTVEVLFPSQVKLQFANVIPGELETSMYNLTYGSYTVPQALNATEPSGTSNFVIGFVSPIKDSATISDSITAKRFRNVNDDSATTFDEIVSAIKRITPKAFDSSLIDDFITVKATISTILMQPDAGAPGMNLAIQFIGNNFASTTAVTTNSTDIVVGPVLAYDTNGDVVTSGGVVLKTIFFISPTATAQTVEVTLGISTLTRTFEILVPAGNSGDFIGQGAGPFALGDGAGRNGDRSTDGTIVLENLLIPAGTTVTVDTTDTDLGTPGNQGYLPAIILVRGDVDINGTLTVVGQAGGHSDYCNIGPAGSGGPGGGGGGGGGANAPQVEGCASPHDFPGSGGDGFAGGGGGSLNWNATDGDAGAGGDGTGALGNAAPGGSRDGGDGGYALADPNQNTDGKGGAEGTAPGTGDAGGGRWRRR